MSNFNLYVPLNDLGYGRLSRGLIKGLQSIGAGNFFLSPIGNPDLEDKQEQQDLITFSQNSRWNKSAPGVAIWHEFDLARFSGSKLVAFPIFETTKFNPLAISYLSQMDAVFTLSEWAAQVVRDNIPSQKKVFSVPAAANVIVNENTEKVKKAKSFTFLAMGKYEARKSPVETIQAYINAFSETKEDTQLICHIHNPFDRNFTANIISILKQLGLSVVPSSQPNNICAIKGSSVVQVITNRVFEEDIFKLFRHAHVGVFPAKAEGWNLPLMEAIQSGLPCIATNYSAHTEYLNSKFGYNPDLLLNKLTMVPAVDGQYFHGDRGNWALPDVNEISEKMKYCYYNYAEVLNKFDNTSIKSEFTWDNMAKRFVNSLQQV